MFYEIEREYKMLKREEMELAILNKIKELKKEIPNIMNLNEIQGIVEKDPIKLHDSIKYRQNYLLERRNLFEVKYYDLIKKVEAEIKEMNFPVEIVVTKKEETRTVINAPKQYEVELFHYHVYLYQPAFEERVSFFKCTTMRNILFNRDCIKENNVYDISKVNEFTLNGQTDDDLTVNLLTDFDNFDINLNTPKNTHTKENWDKKVTYNISNYVMWKLVYDNCVNFLKDEKEKLEEEYKDLENKLNDLKEKIKDNKSYIERHTVSGFKTRGY